MALPCGAGTSTALRYITSISAFQDNIGDVMFVESCSGSQMRGERDSKPVIEIARKRLPVRRLCRWARTRAGRCEVNARYRPRRGDRAPSPSLPAARRSQPQRGRRKAGAVGRT